MKDKKTKIKTIETSKKENNVFLNTEQQKQDYKFISAEEAKVMSDEELESKIKDLEKKANEFGEEIKNKKYKLQVTNIKNAKNLLKFLEKNVKWEYSNLPSYMVVVGGLKEAINQGITEDGFLYLNSSATASLYQQMLKISGMGYNEAKVFLNLLAEVGQGITDAMKQLADDNQKLRNIHTDLSTLDNEKIARQQGITVESVDKTTVKS